MLGAGHGVGRHKMRAVRDVRAEVADHGLFHRPDIADNDAVSKPGRNGLADSGIGADRRADDHEIGPVGGFGRVVGRVVCNRELLHRGQGFRTPGAGDDAAGETLPLHHPGQGRADQADADQRHPFEHRFAHRTSVRSAATTARLSCSRPTVMRRPSGKP